jgi:twitching motility protein PilT
MDTSGQSDLEKAQAALQAQMSQMSDPPASGGDNSSGMAADPAATDTTPADPVATPGVGVDPPSADPPAAADPVAAANPPSNGDDVPSASVGVGAQAIVSAEDGQMVGAPEVRIENILEECIKRNASDIHIQVGLKPILRLDGVLVALENYPVLGQEMVEKLVFAVVDEDQKNLLLKDKEIDFSFAFGELGRFRVNAFHERGSLAAAFRLIPNKIESIESLNMPPVVATFADFPRGLVLVTGPTGSGKSTTLAALVDKINSEKPVHIITIEDPVEFTHKSKKAVVVQREVHYDTFSFAAALRSALREDPDVVLIGEMRDLETISAAITMAETGHLVFATLHTNSAAQSIDRLIDVFPAHQQPQVRAQLSSILMAICSQRLVPAVAGGRIAVPEILVATPAVRSIIREGKTHQLDTVIQTGAEYGMQTMDRTLAKLVQTGVITEDAAREYAVDPTELERLIKGQ